MHDEQLSKTAAVIVLCVCLAMALKSLAGDLAVMAGIVIGLGALKLYRLVQHHHLMAKYRQAIHDAMTDEEASFFASQTHTCPQCKGACETVEMIGGDAYPGTCELCDGWGAVDEATSKRHVSPHIFPLTIPTRACPACHDDPDAPCEWCTGTRQVPHDVIATYIESRR